MGGVVVLYSAHITLTNHYWITSDERRSSQVSSRILAAVKSWAMTINQLSGLVQRINDDR
jgi:hypothetical protein